MKDQEDTEEELRGSIFKNITKIRMVYGYKIKVCKISK